VGVERVMGDVALKKWAEEEESWLQTYAAFKVQV
jgi:hypothetical protein